MTAVGYVNGMDYNFYTKYPTQGVQTGIQKTDIKVDNTETDAYVSQTGETCTDGKDDGKIGFFSAIGNAIKGIGKTVVNGVKGMFTNKEGKFSLGKTLLSIGTAALCIAVPAVGVAACVVGGAMGAIQIGKGAYKAATAETDAEAKMAWQDMGGGAFTVAASVVGAKAGVKAVKGTSTATNGLASLDDAATMGQKAAALGRDMVSSTKNQVGNIKNGAITYAQTAKAKAGELKTNAGNIKNKATSYAEAAKIKYAEAKASHIKNPNALTPDELHTINNAKYQRMFASDDTLAALDKVDNLTGTVKGYYNQGKTAVIDVVKHPIQAGKNVWNAAKGKVTKENAEILWNSVKNAYNKNIKGHKISEVGSKLTGQAKTILTELQNGSSTYAQAVQKYGYDNVAQVLQYLGGTLYSSEAI